MRADFVAPGGRLAQVLPAELIHAQYAERVLNCICAGFSRVVVVMFDKHVFPGAQEEIVLLFAEGRGTGPAPGVEVISCASLDDLQIPDEPGASTHVDAEHKLLAGLLDPAAVAVYDQLRNGELTSLLGEFASVDIGAVTGANDFFVRSARSSRASRRSGSVQRSPRLSTSRVRVCPGATSWRWMRRTSQHGCW